MPNWYCTREQVKRAGMISGVELDLQIDRIIAGASRRIEDITRRFFIPRTQTRVFRWPPRQSGPGYVLYTDQDLISVTSLKTKAQDLTPTTIAAADYFLEPANFGPPYDRIEIDLSSSAALESGNSPQRAIEVVGSWGYSKDTKAAGTVSSGLAADATATSMVCSDASLIDVGDTLLIEAEQIFVTDRSFAALGAILLDMVANLAKDMAIVAVTVDGSHGAKAREVIRIDSEEMYVRSVSGNVLTVDRAVNGSVLASHNDNTAIHISRTLTIERGVNGTTGATHANATTVSKYAPPASIAQLAVAMALSEYHQERAGWGRSIGSGEGASELDGREISRLRKEVLPRFTRSRIGVI